MVSNAEIRKQRHGKACREGLVRMLDGNVLRCRWGRWMRLERRRGDAEWEGAMNVIMNINTEIERVTRSFKYHTSTRIFGSTYIELG